MFSPSKYKIDNLYASLQAYLKLKIMDNSTNTLA